MNVFTAPTRLRTRTDAGNRLLSAGVIAVAALAALAFSTGGPRQTEVLILVSLSAFALGVFIVSPRYEISLLILMVYLGIADGYLKLKSGSQAATLGRDALMFAIVAGAAARLAVRKRVQFPPYTGWVLIFVAACVVQVTNPHNASMVKAAGALKPHLEFVALFFFGYAVMRSANRLRAFLIVLLMITAVNAVVAIYQYQLTPDQLASWGPGYRHLILGTSNIAGRVSLGADQKLHVRPPGLGSDVGFSGGVAALAAPGAIALLLLRRRGRARAIALALAGTVVLGLIAAQVRVSVVQAAFALVAFAALSGFARRRTQFLIAAATVVLVSFFVVSILSKHIGADIFQRYASISPSKAASTSVTYKQSAFSFFGDYVTRYPLGAGLGKVGPASGFVGGSTADLNAESQFNYLILELGIPGLIILCAFLFQICARAARRVRRVPDPELRVLLTALTAGLIGTVATFPGAPLLAGPPAGPYTWFVAGILVYWFVPAQRWLHPPAFQARSARVG